MFDHEIDQIIGRVLPFGDTVGRKNIAIAGPPAAGKSTLAALLVARLNADNPSRAALVPMDGFHLNNNTLAARGLRHRKGAPNTFDTSSFVDLVHRLSEASTDVPYPMFDRAADSTIIDASYVPAQTEIIVLEGNYLLLADAPWNSLHALYDLSVFVCPGTPILEQRLVARWLHYGYDEAQAHEKAQGNDIPNARYVLDHSVDADFTFDKTF